MHQTPCKGIIAFVEGSMERLFVNRNFPHIDLIPVLNGESWTVDRLASQIASLYRVKNVLPQHTIVWLDREGRSETTNQIRQVILDALKGAGANPDRISICIPDRMTENIILADEDLIKGEFSLPQYKYPGDGSNGKGEIKRLYREINVNYKETFHGAGLLKNTYLSRAAANSPSAEGFYSGFNIPCWWRR